VKKIAAYGEILFDIYSNSKNLGGAPLNFIYHINKLTGNGRIISRVGNDLLGREAIKFLSSQGLSTETIQIDSKHLTGAAMVSLNENGVPSFRIEENRAYDFINIDDNIKVWLKMKPDVCTSAHWLKETMLAEQPFNLFLIKR
jgi:fructokinase